jgi:hypothetical protein
LAVYEICWRAQFAWHGGSFLCRRPRSGEQGVGSAKLSAH